MLAFFGPPLTITLMTLISLQSSLSLPPSMQTSFMDGPFCLFRSPHFGGHETDHHRATEPLQQNETSQFITAVERSLQLENFPLESELTFSRV